MSGDIWEIEGSPEAGYKIWNKRSRECPLYAKGNKVGCHAPHMQPVPSAEETKWSFLIVPSSKISDKVESAKDEGIGSN